ncbi:hypothetical protein ZWY2020_005996 [Hordeum vulgare]|nr:hypothetical protein ZWY2020_005996 [Hordeum vulgare]
MVLHERGRVGLGAWPGVAVASRLEARPSRGGGGLTILAHAGDWDGEGTSLCSSIGPGSGRQLQQWALREPAGDDAARDNGRRPARRTGSGEDRPQEEAGQRVLGAMVIGQSSGRGGLDVAARFVRGTMRQGAAAASD